MGLKELNIKGEYRSFIDDVVKDFYIPLLSEAVLYQRAVGFFCSSALSLISRGIKGLIKNGGKIQIVASPRLTEEDYQEIQKGYELRKVIENSLSRELKEPENEEDRENLSFIAQLVAQGILDIKIAFLTTQNEVSMYHEKMGIITDAAGDSVAFSGSMNESENGFRGNYESFDAFCSWTSDAERVFQKQMAFRAIWEDYEPGIEIYEFPEAVKRRLYQYNPELANKLNSVYYDYLESKGYPRERLEINIRSVTNHLRNAKHIVFNEQNRVRYCDADYHQVWENIDFNRYRNLVISSDRIFQDYHELMEELDIRDGYELFYVIKSSLENGNGYDFEISCRRVPVIIFGEGEEADQAVHFLKEISPVDYFDYYQAYEERYGMHKESAQGNPVISNALSKYYIDGQYVIDVPAIDGRDAEIFKEVLSSKKIWFIDDLEKVFKEICVHSSEDALNAAAFKRIGYSLNAGYAYDDRYGSVTNLFDAEIFNGDVVDMTSFDRRLTTLSAFGSALDKTKKSLQYIETAPKLLMSLECVKRHYGISFEEIKTLQDWALNICEEKYFNAHSLWNDIKDISIVRKLQNNEWMCTCIFRQQEGVYSLSVAAGIILAKDSTILSVSKVCEWIVENEGKMDIHNLTNVFNSMFNTNIPCYKIAEKLKTDGYWEICVTDSFDDYLDALMIGSEGEIDLFQEEFF